MDFQLEKFYTLEEKSFSDFRKSTEVVEHYRLMKNFLDNKLSVMKITEDNKNLSIPFFQNHGRLSRLWKILGNLL